MLSMIKNFSINKNTILLFLFVTLSVYSYSQNSLEDAIILKDLAKEDVVNKNYDNALINLNKAYDIAKTDTNKRFQGECLYQIANVYNLKNDDNNSLKYYLRAEEFFRKTNSNLKLAQTYFYIAGIYYKSSSYINSIAYYSNALLTNDNLSEKAVLYENTGYSYLYLKNYDSSILFFDKMKSFAISQKDTILTIKALNNLIQVNKKQNNYQAAIDNNYKIFNLYSIQRNYNGQAIILNNIGYNYVLMENFSEAERVFKESISFQKSANSPKDFLANTNINIAICLQNQNKVKEAIPFFEEAAQIWSQLQNVAEKAKVYNLIALTYYNIGDLHNASTYSEEAVIFAEQSNDVEVLQNCYHTYSIILQDGNDYQNALDYYKKYLKARDSILFENRIAQQELVTKIQELEKIEKELKLLLAEEEINEILLEQLRLEKEKQQRENEILLQQQELQQAKLLQQEYALMIQTQQNLALQKQKEIEDLENAKKISELELLQSQAEAEKNLQEIALLETEKEKQQLEIDKNNAAKRFLKWVSLLFGVIMLLIIIFLIYTRKANRRLNVQKVQILQQNNELSTQKEEIQSQADELRAANEQVNEQRNILENRHKQITDSITYASRIQSAMLPDSSVLTKFFPSNFIIFKPKDIVSGDFYWTKEVIVNDIPILYLAAADCTGHGVPGAFVSMLGMSLLNEIVNKNNNIQPNEVLNQLRNEIKVSLKQHNQFNETKDGMDIALCRINKKEGVLAFAGAHNPMYLIRNKTDNFSEEQIDKIGNKKIRKFIADNEIYNFYLYEVKADFQPIGVYVREREFTNVELEIVKGDKIYIFSDGYIDQFGGEKGNKYQSVNFKRKILSIQNMSLNQQKASLIDNFEKWTSEYKTYNQLDDVLVVGIEV